MEVRKLLVANRGEIAARIFRTCDRLDIATVAVAAPDDAGALHTRLGGEVREIESYLDAEEHLRAARESGADAIHPGYGFLAESASFAAVVEEAGLTWVGPPQEVLRAAGDKLEAKQLAARAGVPVLPSGSAAEVGFPLLVKAAAGGGGRGMRVVRAAGELDEALEAARREAKAGFGDETVFLERYLERPRHVEVQLLADTHGTVVHLGERDCSVQRRHQKVLEESPAPGLDVAVRDAMTAAAVELGRELGYVGAGTAEFVVQGDEFYFLE
ncbi:MAG: ATP-grasp domain-containing protein, partial [Actinomycetota bacterium]|nr:ATP-grasp domain-containing protein [Actinomycetota bacterium]